MKTNPINSSLQLIDFERRSAIIQCHIDKKRLWILAKNGEFDYYSQIGDEPSLHIIIDKNVTPKRLWSNQRGTRFIVETIDFSLYYFQTSDLLSDLFYPSKANPSSQTIGMKNFFRIGALKNGPASTIFFDDDPKDPKSTKQIFIVVKGGGMLVLSIDTLQDKETKEQTTIISDFVTFPTLFNDSNILDMKIFRIIERQSDNFILNQIREKAKQANSHDYKITSSPNTEKSLRFIQKISELYEIAMEAKNQIFQSRDLIEQFRNLYRKIDDSQEKQQPQPAQPPNLIQIKKASSKNKLNNNNDTTNNIEPDSNLISTTYLLDEIEKFLKTEENIINDIDLNYNIKVSDNPSSFHPNFSIWLDCIENMEMVKKETDKTMKNIYKSAFLYQQMFQLASNRKLQDIKEVLTESITEEEDNQEQPQSDRKPSNGDVNNNNNNNDTDNNGNNNNNNNDSKINESIENINNNEEDIDEDLEEEEDNFDLENELKFDFEDDFYNNGEKKKKKKEKQRKKRRKKIERKDIIVLDKIKERITEIIEKLRENMNGQELTENNGKLIELRKTILVQLKQINEISETTKKLKTKLKNVFQRKRIKPLPFIEDYMLDRKKHFSTVEDEHHITSHFLYKANKYMNNIVDMLKTQASFNVTFIREIESFCKFSKPFFDESNMSNDNDTKYNIIRTYVIFLAEDRIIRGSSKDGPVKILKKIQKKKAFEFSFNNLSKKFNFSKIDRNSRLVHKPLKASPSHKRPTFYIVSWDRENNVNVCYTFKFQKLQNKKKKFKEESNDSYIYKLKNKKEGKPIVRVIFRKSKPFEFEPDMGLIFYQVTPSGMIVVQSGERADSKAVAYEMSSLIHNETNVSSTRGKMLWFEEINDYSLLPILNCDFCPETGLIIYNSMKISLITRENVDLNSFNSLTSINDAPTIKKVRKYLAKSPQQENETFFILLIYAMNQLFEKESDFQNRKNRKVDVSDDDQNDQKINSLSNLSKMIFEAREAFLKLLKSANCSKMSIFLFLMDDKKLSDKINFCLTTEKNDGRLFERFRRFRIEYLVWILDSINIKMKRQQEALLLMALDLLMQCYSTRNNKNIYLNDSATVNTSKKGSDIAADTLTSEEEAKMNMYFKKCFTDKITIEDISSFTKKYGSSLLSVNCAYYILKSFPVLDAASFFKSEKDCDAEITFSKVNKFLVRNSEETFSEAGKSLVNFLNDYQANIHKKLTQKDDGKTKITVSNNSIEIDYMISRLLLYGIEKHSNQPWFFNSFTNFFKDLENLTILPKIPRTILSLFNFALHAGKRNFYNKSLTDEFDYLLQFDPVIRYMKCYYEKENKKDQVDILFSIFVSMELLKQQKFLNEIESLRKKKDFNMTLAIYRSARLRVNAARLLEDLKMTSVALDVVLDVKEISTAVKFASSLKDENTMLYLVRTASRRTKDKFEVIYNKVVDAEQIASSTNEKLYDVLMCIPEDKLNEMSSLLENIFKTLEEIDKKSEEKLKKINVLLDKLKPKSDMKNSNYLVTSPFSQCDLCHNTVLNKDCYLFPCGHAFHESCYLERKERDNFDREKASAQPSNSQKFTTNANLCLCPLCGLGAVELIGTPMYALYEEEDVKALMQNPIQIDEYVSDDYDYE